MMFIRAGFCRPRCTSLCRPGTWRTSFATWVREALELSAILDTHSEERGYAGADYRRSTLGWNKRARRTRPRTKRKAQPGVGTRRRTGWPTSSDVLRRSAPPRLPWRRTRSIRSAPRTTAGRVRPRACAGRGGPCSMRTAVPPDRGAAQLHRPGQPDPASARWLRARLQRADRCQCRASGDRSAPPRCGRTGRGWLS